MKQYKLLAAVVLLGLTWTGITRAEDQPIEQQLIDAMNKVFGVRFDGRTEPAGRV